MSDTLPAAVRRLIVSVVVSRLGSGLTLPYTLIFLHEVRRLPLPTVGVLMAVPGLVGLVAVPVGGALVDRIGPRLVLVGCQLLQAGGCLDLALAHTAAGVLPGMALIGCGLGPSFSAVASLLSELVEGPEQVQRAFGLNFTALNAAIAVGSLVSSAVVDVHRPVTFVALFVAQSVSACAAAAVLPRGHRPQPRLEHEQAPSYREALSDPLLRRVCVLSLAFALGGYASLDSGVPAYSRVLGHVQPSAIGLVFVVNTVVIVSLQLLFLRLLRGRRRTSALAATGALWAVAWSLLGLVSVGTGPTRLVALLLYGGLFGIGEMFMAPSMQPLVNALATDRLRGRYNALSGLMFSVCFVLAPAVSSVLIGNGLGHAWLAGLVCTAGAAAVVALRLRSRLTAEQDGLSA